MYSEYDFWIIFTAGFTPLPYKVFTISAGAFYISLPMFIIASIVSRGARFFLVAYLIWCFGPQIQGFIDKYFNWLAIGFTVLLIGGFVIIKYLV
jgi:membrane protein DedA with SNARE-associated domain